MIALSDTEFKLIADHMKKNYGLNLSAKRTLIESRLQNVLPEYGCQTFLDYYRQIQADQTGEAAMMLVNRLTTNFTYFLREADHFNFFRDIVLPHLAKSVPERDLRVWSAGCASGEEPYTLAMLMAEYFGSEKTRWDTTVLATDISRQVLEAAMRGVYAEEQVTSIPESWHRKYLRKTGQDGYTMSDEIKDSVVFRVFNLMNRTFPFKRKFHAIFCRNVMIYFDEPTKSELVERFYKATEPGGYLFIGHSEAINRGGTRYQCVAPAIYRKG